MKKTSFTFLMLAIASAMGCAGHTIKVLDAQWVSMTNTTAPDTTNLVLWGGVHEEYCVDSWTSGSFGLMDEVVKKAENRNQLAYIKDASFTRTSNKPCVQLSGTGYKRK